MKHPDLFSWRTSNSDPWETSSLKVALFLLSLEAARERIATAVELPASALFAWLDALDQGERWGVA
jgi:hypothetical protein